MGSALNGSTYMKEIHMHYLRIAFCFLLLTTPATHAMDIQVPDAADSANTIIFGIPHDIWKRLVCNWRYRNALRLVNKYLHSMASWHNRKEIVKANEFCIHHKDADKIIFECTEKGEYIETWCLLHFFKIIGHKNPTMLTNLDIPLWHYAQTEEMLNLLKMFGTYPGNPEPSSITAVRSGDIAQYTPLLRLLTENMPSHEQNRNGRKARKKLILRDACHACQADQAACLKLIIPHIKTLFSKKKDVILCNLLFHAVYNGNVSCITTLLNENIDVNTPLTDNFTLLSLAATEGRTYVVKLLLEHGADQMIANVSGLRPLNYALMSQHAEIIELLINNLPGTQENRDYINAAKLHAACISGDIEAVSTALRKGHSLAPLGFPTAPSPLHLATMSGHIPLIQWLIAKGYCVNEADKTNLTPILVAGFANQFAAVKVLHEAGAHLEDTIENTQTGSRDTLCKYAVSNNNLELLQYLVQHGADLKQTLHPNGVNLLHVAAQRKKSGPIVKYLIEQGIPVDASFALPENDLTVHYTPFAHACLQGHLSAAKELVAGGANIEYKAINSDKPVYAVHGACIEGHEKIMRFFIEEYTKYHKFLDHTLFNELILCAVRNGHIKIVKMLLDAGARLNDNLIEIAHEQEYAEIEQLLLKVKEERRGISW